MAGPLQATNVDNMWKATSGLYRVEVDLSEDRDTEVTAAPEPGTGWTEVRGLSQFAPKNEQSKEDDSTIATGGHASEWPVGQAWTAEVAGFTIGEKTGGVLTLDAGTNALLEAARNFGSEGIVRLRYMRTDDVDESFSVFATSGVTRAGDKPPALDKFSGTLTGRGKPQKIAKWDETGAITGP